jgi:8-amino-7-oxononanoate synthase/dethiobiotin synthetase
MSPDTSQIIVVTGTDTGVGKTITTAALAAVIDAMGRSVAVDKPTQTGVTGHGHGDVDEVGRLVGDAVTRSEGIRLQYPMAPVAAADREARALPSLPQHVARIGALAGEHEHVIVEGAGGLLVALTPTGQTIADLVLALQPAPLTVVVCRAGLGTLNHTALTLEALTRRGIHRIGLVIGDWPRSPGPIEVSNLAQLRGSGVPILALISPGAGGLPPRVFRRMAPSWWQSA